MNHSNNYVATSGTNTTAQQRQLQAQPPAGSDFDSLDLLVERSLPFSRSSLRAPHQPVKSASSCSKFPPSEQCSLFPDEDLPLPDEGGLNAYQPLAEAPQACKEAEPDVTAEKLEHQEDDSGFQNKDDPNIAGEQIAQQECLLQEIHQLKIRCKDLETQLAVVCNESTVEQMHSEIKKLAAAKKHAVEQADSQLHQIQELENKISTLEKVKGDAQQESKICFERLAEQTKLADTLQLENRNLQETIAVLEANNNSLKSKLINMVSGYCFWMEGPEQCNTLRHEMQHEATTEKSKQCDNEIIDFKNAKQKALSRAVKAEEELQSTSKERDEAVQHLFSNQKVIRDLETRLRKVARERDEALGQVKNVDSKLRAAKTKTLAAKQIEDKNHHRHVDLEHQRAELDTFCGELKHREEAISNREKKTIGLLEQIENREKEVEVRESLLEGRIADAENAKQQAAKLQQSLQQQQRDLDKERTVLARHAAELETAKAQAEREYAALTQERATLTELRIQRLDEQERMIQKLAEERSSIAKQKAEAERSVDAAKSAELSAGKILADLKAQAADAKQQVEDAGTKLADLQKRNKAEEFRLSDLRIACEQQQKQLAEELRQMLQLGENVKLQSEEIAHAFAHLHTSKESVQNERHQLASLKREIDLRQRSIECCADELKQTLHEIQEKKVMMVSERRRALAERSESQKATESLRQAQQQLAIQLQAAGALHGCCDGGEGLTRFWKLLQDTGFAIPQMSLVPHHPPRKIATVDESLCQATASSNSPIETVPSSHEGSRKENSPASHSHELDRNVNTLKETHTTVCDDSARYWNLLADLETSIETWRAQLRSGVPLTVSGAASPETAKLMMLNSNHEVEYNQNDKIGVDTQLPCQAQRNKQEESPRSDVRGPTNSGQEAQSHAVKNQNDGNMGHHQSSQTNEKGNVEIVDGQHIIGTDDKRQEVSSSGARVILDAACSNTGHDSMKQEHKARRWLKFKSNSSPSTCKASPIKADSANQLDTCAGQQEHFTGDNEVSISQRNNGMSWPGIFSFRKSSDAAHQVGSLAEMSDREDTTSIKAVQPTNEFQT